MAIRKKIRPTKGAPQNRVKKITNLDQWESLMDVSKNRLVIVQFYQAGSWTCKQMRPIYIKLSTSPQFRKILFAEVEADEVPEIIKKAGVSRIPTFNCYSQAERVDSYTGGVPNQLQQMLKENLATYSNSGGPLALALKALAGVAVIGAVGFFAFKNSPLNKTAGNDASVKEDLNELRNRLAAARNKLRLLEKVNRTKQARAQRKIVDQLESKKRLLERGSSTGNGDNNNNAEGSHGTSSRAHNQQRSRDDSNADEFWPLPPPGPKSVRKTLAMASVLYTDEEDEYNALSGGSNTGSSGSKSSNSAASRSSRKESSARSGSGGGSRRARSAERGEHGSGSSSRKEREPREPSKERKERRSEEGGDEESRNRRRERRRAAAEAATA